MVNHLPLPDFVALNSRRSAFAPIRPLDLQEQAQGLARALGGITTRMPDLFSPRGGEAGAASGVDEPTDLGRVVLKFTGRGVFNKGPFGERSLGMTSLAENDSRQFFAISDEDSRANFFQNASAVAGDPSDAEITAAWRKALLNIVDIDIYGPEDRRAPDLPDIVGTDERVAVEVILWPTSLLSDRFARPRGRERLAEVVGEIRATDPNATILAQDNRPDTLRLRVLAGADVLQVLLSHPLVERIHGSFNIPVTQRTLEQSSPPDSDITLRDVAIGVIDDLVITSNPWLNTVVVAQAEFPSTHSFAATSGHGTQVAGIAAYGDLRPLLGGEVPETVFPIYSARIAEANNAGQAVVVGDPGDQIEAAMRWLRSQDVRIVVCAFSRSYAHDGALPSTISARIDELARELNLVVVTATGNVTDAGALQWHADYPQYLEASSARVAVPGTASLALTAGSIAHSDTVDIQRTPQGLAIARERQPSPFTRTGFAPGGNSRGHQKPELVHFGGNWATDQATGALVTDDPNLAVTTLIPPDRGRLFGVSAGTSLAAPSVAHQVARIADRYPHASANLLRALTGLSSVPNDTSAFQDATTLASAYGVPVADRVLESGGNKAILVHEGVIPTDTRVVIDVPVPPEFLDSSSQRRRRFRVALAFDPPVRRSRKDYVAGRIEFDFVAGLDFAAIKQAYEQQPPRQYDKDGHEIDAGRVELPGRVQLKPGVRALSGNTLVVRTFANVHQWNPYDPQGFHLVVTHLSTPATGLQREAYSVQPYALAVEMIEEGAADIDLHAAVQNILDARAAATARVRGRASTQRGRGGPQ